MSLIGDALKKAHLEAVRQEGSSTRLAHTPGVAQYRRDPDSSKRNWTAVLIISNVLLAAIVTAVVLWGLNRDTTNASPLSSAVDAEATQKAPAQPATTLAQTAQTSDPEAVAPVTPIEEPQVEIVREPESPASEPSPPEVTSETSVAQPPPAAAIPEPSPVATTRSRSRNGLVDGQTYMRSIPVPNGTDLTLNGMSVAGGKGVALINGRMVREGDRVGPFTVGRIADRRVQLHYDDITIYLKLR